MTTNRDLLHRYVERYNAGDLDACIDLYADDAVQRMHDGIFHGKDEIRQRLAVELTAFPDARYAVVSFVDEGDTFADEWILAGTHTGPFSLPDGTQIPPTGKAVVVDGMEYVRMRDGKIIVDNLYYDSAAPLIQLGLVPAEAIV
jgi:steroid delta-isomerase-like uncharacterized protein